MKVQGRRITGDVNEDEEGVRCHRLGCRPCGSQEEDEDEEEEDSGSRIGGSRIESEDVDRSGAGDWNDDTPGSAVGCLHACPAACPLDPGFSFR